MVNQGNNSGKQRRQSMAVHDRSRASKAARRISSKRQNMDEDEQLVMQDFKNEVTN